MNQQVEPNISKEAKKLFTKQCEFLRGVTNVSQLPDSDILEVAFAGRSNVGKSSLLNALTNNGKLARTSQTPGCTSQLNFFCLNKELMMVDLPGYGYARTSKKERGQWNQLIKDYLRGRPQLMRVLLLIDGRRGVMDSDEEIMDILDEAARSYQWVVTKADKMKQAEKDRIAGQHEALSVKHPALHPEYITTSSAKKTGLQELKEAIVALAS